MNLSKCFSLKIFQSFRVNVLCQGLQRFHEVWEERQRRVASELDAERGESDQRAHRLRQELRRMEQDERSKAQSSTQSEMKSFQVLSKEFALVPENRIRAA